jgi:ferredoxin-NADP reductase
VTELPRFPRHLYGKPRADRLMASLTGIAAAYRWVSGVSGRYRPPVTEFDRDLVLRIEAARTEAEGVVSLRLVPLDQAPLPVWRPGAHLDLRLPSGRVRQYSLCGDPEDRTYYRIAVRRIPTGEGGSLEVHEKLRAGSVVTVRGPRNAFPFVASPRYLFVAGGIGITPILPMVRRAAATGSGVDWRLVYTGRDRASMPFLAELEALDTDRVWIRPDDEFGIPASGSELLEGMPEGASVYCCGPVPMITGIRLDLASSTGQAVYLERFSTPPIVNGKPFQLELRRTGVTLDVPADRSALDVVREALPDVAYSCRQGFCGTCAVRTPAGESVRICVAREPGGTLVLNL